MKQSHIALQTQCLMFNTRSLHPLHSSLQQPATAWVPSQTPPPKHLAHDEQRWPTSVRASSRVAVRLGPTCCAEPRASSPSRWRWGADESLGSYIHADLYAWRLHWKTLAYVSNISLSSAQGAGKGIGGFFGGVAKVGRGSQRNSKVLGWLWLFCSHNCLCFLSPISHHFWLLCLQGLVGAAASPIGGALAAASKVGEEI